MQKNLSVFKVLSKKLLAIFFKLYFEIPVDQQGKNCKSKGSPGKRFIISNSKKIGEHTNNYNCNTSNYRQYVSNHSPSPKNVIPGILGLKLSIFGITALLTLYLQGMQASLYSAYLQYLFLLQWIWSNLTWLISFPLESPFLSSSERHSFQLRVNQLCLFRPQE